jgi:hypothetical protein
LLGTNLSLVTYHSSLFWSDLVGFGLIHPDLGQGGGAGLEGPLHRPLPHGGQSGPRTISCHSVAVKEQPANRSPFTPFGCQGTSNRQPRSIIPTVNCVNSKYNGVTCKKPPLSAPWRFKFLPLRVIGVFRGHIDSARFPAQNPAMAKPPKKLSPGQMVRFIRSCYGKYKSPSGSDWPEYKREEIEREEWKIQRLSSLGKRY